MDMKKKSIAGRWKRATGHCALLNMSSCSTDHSSEIKDIVCERIPLIKSDGTVTITLTVTSEPVTTSPY